MQIQKRLLLSLIPALFCCTCGHGQNATRPAAASSLKCPVFPADNPWNANVSMAPEFDRSGAIVNQVLADGPGFLHADFGGGGEAGGLPERPGECWRVELASRVTDRMDDHGCGAAHQ